LLRSDNGLLVGTIWRTSSRELQMLGYVAVTDWERQFFTAVTSLAGPPAAGTVRPPYEFKEYYDPQREPSRPYLERLRLMENPDGPMVTFDGEWIDNENPSFFVQVRAFEFGTLQANGLWTRTSLPQDGEEILSVFRRVLNRVDTAASF